MTNPNFDWIKLLPESEQKDALAKRNASNEAFFKGFPIRPDSLEDKADEAELRQAGIEGRAAFDRAIAIVDARKETERLLNAATEHRCRNCGDPHTEIKEMLCGTCREMGCALSSTERNTHG